MRTQLVVLLYSWRRGDLRAARRHRGGRGGGPQLRAVVVHALRLPRAAVIAVVIGQHQTLFLGVKGRAAVHPALAVRRVRITIAAARLSRGHWRLADRLDARNKEARRAAFALVAALAHIALIKCLGRIAHAAAWLLGGGRGGEHAVVRVIRLDPLAVGTRAFHCVLDSEALGLSLVRRSAAAARRLRRRGRGGPQQRTIVAIDEVLPRAAVIAIAVRQHQTLALRVIARARLHPSLAVRRIGIAIAAARIDSRYRWLADGVRSRVRMAARTALAFVTRLFLVAHLELARLIRATASGLLRGGRGRRGRRQITVRIVKRLDPLAV